MLVAMTTIPAVAFILFSASRARDEARAKIEADTVYLARLAAREHSRQITEARDLLNTLASQPTEWTSRQPEATRLLAVLAGGFSHFANMGVLSPSGRIITSVVAPDSAANMSRLDVFQRALSSRGIEVSDYLVGLIVHRPILFLVRPVRDRADSVTAVLFVALDLDWFNRLAEEADLPPGSSFTILDREGRVLARNQDAKRWIGRRFDEGAGSAGRPSGSRAVTTSDDGDDVRRLVALAPLPGAEGISVLVVIPEAAAFAASNRALATNLMALACFAIITAGAGTFGADFFVLKEIRRMCEAVRRVGGGDLRARVPSTRRDAREIVELARAFNLMAESLQARQAETEAAQEGLRLSESRLCALTRRLQRTREEENSRIARDLHDELGQSLSALKIELARLKAREGSAGSQESARAAGIGRHLEEFMARIDEIIDFIRRIATELRPGVLDRLGLASALEWQAREFSERTGIACEAEVDRALACDPEVATQIFRITQEALTNIARHAGADRAWIFLRRSGKDDLELVVRDNGRGISRGELEAENSLGILGMRERARIAGARLEILPGEAGGTVIEVRGPSRRTGPAEAETKEENSADA
jgi:signal transduction histidine kinase